MMLNELKPNHKIGDVVVYRDTLTIESGEFLLQAKIIGAVGELEDGEWIWSYRVEPIDCELAVYLNDGDILFNLSKT